MRPLVITERITRRETGAFKKYLQEVHNIPTITPDEEYELALRSQQGDEEARNELVSKNLRFVISVAKQYANNKVGLEDLINEGNYGLIEASKRFDPTTGFKFISYAVWWIRRCIMEYLTKYSRTIRIPSNQAANITKLTDLVGELEQKLERKATKIELETYQPIIDGDFSEKDIKFFMNLEITNTASLDKPFGEEGDGALIDTIESTMFDSTDHSGNREGDKINAEILLNLLPKPVQKHVITRFFGLDGEESQDLRQIADRLDMSRERARQIKDNSLRILKEKADMNNLRWMLTR
jgi:RNA polymerase primary sigma factor